jgi:hypothetical protein
LGFGCDGICQSVLQFRLTTPEKEEESKTGMFLWFIALFVCLLFLFLFFFFVSFAPAVQRQLKISDFFELILFLFLVPV